MIYNSQDSFAKFKNMSDFKEISLDSMHKRLQDFNKKFDEVKKVSPQIKKNKDLKTKVLDNAGDLFSELYYVYKEKYEKKKDNLNKDDIQKLDLLMSGSLSVQV